MSKLYLNSLIHKLPEVIVKDIFNYVIPSSDKILFRNSYIYKENYEESIETDDHNKYLAAFIDNERVANKDGIYLVRLCKKNIYKKNKSKKDDIYKYYLIKEYKKTYCGGCGVRDCYSEYCRGGFDIEYYLNSKYVGKNIDIALLSLFYYTKEDISWVKK